MSKKIITLSGIAKELHQLTGIHFKFIATSKGVGIPFCSKKNYCPAKDFVRQRKLCKNIEAAAINKLKSSDSKVQKFRCGLAEIILPFFNQGSLSGVVLTSKIRPKNSRFRTKTVSACLDSKQLIALSLLLNYCQNQFEQTISRNLQQRPVAKDGAVIQRARSFIEKNYHRLKLSLRDLSKEVNASYYFLCRLFKRKLNLTPTQYLTLIRLKAALRLLENFNLNVAQISYAVGFSDAQYFDRVFKKNLGCTPKQYRHSSKAKRQRIKRKISLAIF